MEFFNKYHNQDDETETALVALIVQTTAKKETNS